MGWVGMKVGGRDGWDMKRAASFLHHVSSPCPSRNARAPNAPDARGVAYEQNAMSQDVSVQVGVCRRESNAWLSRFPNSHPASLTQPGMQC